MNLRKKTGWGFWIAALALVGLMAEAIPAYSAKPPLATKKELTVKSEDAILLDWFIKKHPLSDMQAYTVNEVELLGDVLRDLGLPPQTTWLTQTVLTRSQNAKKFVAEIKKYVAPRFDAQKAREFMEWAKSPLGRKVEKLDKQSGEPGNKQELKTYIELAQSFPPEERRLNLAEQLVENWDIVGHSIDMLTPVLKLWLPHRDRFMEVRTPALLKRFRASLQGVAKKDIIHSMVFGYRELSDGEFEKYVTFTGSDAGQWYRKVFIKGTAIAFARQMTRARVELETLLSQIQSEKEGLKLLKESFPPGERYVVLRKRDPFMPLINDKGEIQNVFPSKTKPRHDQAGKKRGELVDMPLIPMEVYKKIQRDNPSMLADLKYYEELFNDTGELQRMEEEEYNETVAQYRGTLLRARGVGESMIKTGLQIDYSKLKFVGVIRKKDQRIALIETHGLKGHTAKVGTLMGPNLGVVEAVREDTIIIVERYRNYLGEVLANKKSIKFSTPPQQG